VLGRVGLAQAELLLSQGLAGAAAEYADQAIGDFDHVEAHLLSADALRIRGDIHLATGRPQEARASWEAGLAALALLSDHAGQRIVRELRARISSLGLP